MNRARRTMIAGVLVLVVGALAAACGSCTVSTAAVPRTAAPPTTSARSTSSGGSTADRADGLDLSAMGKVELAIPTTVPSALDLPGFDASIDLATCELDVSITNEAIGFGKDSAEIGDEGRRKLGLVAVQLNGATEVLVVGHTSTEASAEYNQALSKRRAQAVADLLAPGVPDARFDVRGAGETQPLVPDDDTEAKRAQNRRVAVHARIVAEVCS